MRKIVGLILFTVFLIVGLQNTDRLMNAWRYMISLFMPILLGGCIAFVMNVPMRRIESKLFSGKRIKKAHMRRIISLLITIAILVGVVLIVCLMVIPEVVRSIKTLATTYLPGFYTRAIDYMEHLTNTYPSLRSFGANWEAMDWHSVGKAVLDFLLNGGLLKNTVGMASSIVSGATNFILGFVFSIYVLLQKEKLARQIRLLCYAYLPEPKVDRFVQISKLANQTFSNFISGQCLEAIILGTMFFISMTVFHLHYALLIAVLIAISALIPIFGAFIGCIVGAFLILIVSPVEAFWFIILFFALQQIEGNLIYPHVVGNSVGLPSIWVLVAVTLGAGTMGVLGMLLAIPIVSVLYSILRDSTKKRILERRIDAQKLQ